VQKPDVLDRTDGSPTAFGAGRARVSRLRWCQPAMAAGELSCADGRCVWYVRWFYNGTILALNKW